MRTCTSPLDIAYQTKLAEAVALRLAKVPYDEIIQTVGHWNSIQACQKAVAGYLRRNQTRIVEDSRAESIAILEDNISILRAKFKKGQSILVAREIKNHLRELNLLQGNYAPTRIAETDTKGNDVPRSITVNVVKSSKILTPELDSPAASEPDN